jgi:hypothetical protein
MLSTLQSSEMYSRQIEVEGWLRVIAEVLRVRSSQRAVELARSIISLNSHLSLLCFCPLGA